MHMKITTTTTMDQSASLQCPPVCTQNKKPHAMAIHTMVVCRYEEGISAALDVKHEEAALLYELPQRVRL
jgi:hypothetical protein